MNDADIYLLQTTRKLIGSQRAFLLKNQVSFKKKKEGIRLTPYPLPARLNVDALFGSELAGRLLNRTIYSVVVRCVWRKGSKRNVANRVPRRIVHPVEIVDQGWIGAAVINRAALGIGRNKSDARGRRRDGSASDSYQGYLSLSSFERIDICSETRSVARPDRAS